MTPTHECAQRLMTPRLSLSPLGIRTTTNTRDSSLSFLLLNLTATCDAEFSSKRISPTLLPCPLSCRVHTCPRPSALWIGLFHVYTYAPFHPGTILLPLAAIQVSSILVYTTYRIYDCLLYTSPSPRDGLLSRMPSSA